MAEEGEERLKGIGVEEVGGCWGWADRLEGWVARRMRREERRLVEKGEMGVLGLVFAIVWKEITWKEGKLFEVLTEKTPLPLWARWVNELERETRSKRGNGLVEMLQLQTI